MKQKRSLADSPVRFSLAVIFITVTLGLIVISFVHWPPETMLLLLCVNQVIKNWKEVLAICVISFFTCLISFSIVSLLGWLFDWGEAMRTVSLILLGIYVLGLILDEHNRQPYIWLWQEGKRLFRRKAGPMLLN